MNLWGLGLRIRRKFPNVKEGSMLPSSWNSPDLDYFRGNANLWAHAERLQAWGDSRRGVSGAAWFRRGSQRRRGLLSDIERSARWKRTISFFFLIVIYFWLIDGLQYWFPFCRTSTWINYNIHMSLPSWTPSTSHHSHPSRWLQSPTLSSLSHKAKSHWLSIYIC